MINALTSLKNAITSPSRQIKGKVSLYASGTQALTTYTYADALQSIEISRMGGDSKFFGFGICQTATVKLKDKDNQITVNKNDYFIPQFGAIISATATVPNWALSAFPQFFVEEVQKDEVSGTLTITAGDRLHNLALQYRVNELSIEAPYTIKVFAEVCAAKMGLTVVLDDTGADVEFAYEYPEGANFDGAETLKDALNAVAEATQTIYYIKGSELHFKSLWRSNNAVLTVDKSQYFNLETKPKVYIGAVCSATELGENIIAKGESAGITQYAHENPFWDKLNRDVLASRLEDAMYKNERMGFAPFTCSWRGNFLLEIGDMVAYTTKTGGVQIIPFLNDTTTYDGGFRQTTSWSYEENANETLNNPSTLGTALKQTFATVDKVNKEITMVASQSASNSSELSALKISTDNISANVENVEAMLNDTNGAIETLTSRVDAVITAEDVTIQVQNEIANGIDKIVTSTGFTFNDEGLTVSKSDSEISTRITEDGMTVSSNSGDDMLIANNQGVQAKNLHAHGFLIIGTNSRFEDYYGNRTGCFWIGG